MFSEYLQVDKALREVDKEISRLLNGLYQRNLLNCVNILLVADHGMADAGKTRILRMQDFLPQIANETRFWDGIFSRFQPKDGSKGK